MGWLNALTESHFVQQNYQVLLAAAVISVPALVFLLYRKYSQRTTYESVDDNELMKAKLEAARLKQQEEYDQFIKENGDALKEQNEQLEKELKPGNNDKPKPKGESLLVDRDYFPLVGGGTGTSYRPVKKRACGPCGGGGCG